MDSVGFVDSVQKRLEPIAPVILPGIIKKQLEVVEATREDLTPEKAIKFIERMGMALKTFLGPEGTKMAHQMMMKEFRRCAPEYFERKALI